MTSTITQPRSPGLLRQYSEIASMHARVCSHPSHAHTAFVHGELAPANGQYLSNTLLGDVGLTFEPAGLGLFGPDGTQAEEGLGTRTSGTYTEDGLGDPYGGI